MSKKKNNEEITEVTCEAPLPNSEPSPYRVLERKVRDFIDATINLLEIKESIIRAERQRNSAEEMFDSSLKWLKKTMDSYKEKDV